MSALPRRRALRFLLPRWQSPQWITGHYRDERDVSLTVSQAWVLETLHALLLRWILRYDWRLEMCSMWGRGHANGRYRGVWESCGCFVRLYAC